MVSVNKHQSLTHLPLDKIAAISQTTLSDAFLWKFEFWFNFRIVSINYIPALV